MSILERLKRLFGGEDRTEPTDERRIDSMTTVRAGDQIMGGEHGGLAPPGWLPTGVDEGRPKK
jgi:hypothetical protein